MPKHIFMIVFALFTTSLPSYAETVDRQLLGLLNNHGQRFEAQSALTCPGGENPNLSPYIQYHRTAQHGWDYWTIGTAGEYAPFIWLSQSRGQLQIAVSAAVIGSWIYCDDDGDEFERSKTYWFGSLYDVAQVRASVIDLNLTGFTPIYDQSVSQVVSSNQLLQRRDLQNASFFYNDPIVDGPSEHTTFAPAQNLALNVIAVTASGFTVNFPDACGPNQPLRVAYVKSTCSEDQHCSELPVNTNP